jgi:hypothetical protein
MDVPSMSYGRMFGRSWGIARLGLEVRDEADVDDGAPEADGAFPFRSGTL